MFEFKFNFTNSVSQIKTNKHPLNDHLHSNAWVKPEYLSASSAQKGKTQYQNGEGEKNLAVNVSQAKTLEVWHR